MKTVLILLSMLFLAGCSHSKIADRFLDESPEYILEGDRRLSLIGPYKWVKTLSPNTILTKKDGQEVVIILRGCLPAGDLECDKRAEQLISMPMSEGAFLLKGSVKPIGPNKISAVVYTAMKAFYVGTDEDGVQHFNNISYDNIQLLLFAYGRSRLDHSDTENPLYEEFAKAEAVAKKHGIGCWGKTMNSRANQQR